ncbi:acyl-CoA dehydrogenase family protein [Alsobacter sp. KACC 23698]|uniref:Acyl-CoA dehydrogenase family protein n=1 Tax=Alsobacter sp. KACC 23698 TaxID=3149229 RepID=A0AAU7JH35_9HYPH
MSYENASALRIAAAEDHLHPAQAEADRQLAVLRRARRVADVAARHADAVDAEARFPAEAVDAMKAEGLLGLMIPAEFGGGGATLADVASVCGQIALGCSAAAMVYAMHQIKVSSLISHGMDSPWHRSFMRRVATEQLLIASATTEAGIGGDLRNSICAIEQDGGLFRLAKDASVISYALQADAIMATARRNPDAPSSDQVMAVLTADQYTLRKTGGWNTLGMRGTCSDGFRLEANAAIEQVIPKPFAEIAAQSMLVHSHLLWGSVWQGVAAAALSRAQSYVRSEARRRPDMTPPCAVHLAEAAGKLQAMQATIGSALRRYEAARHEADELSSMGFAVAINNVKLVCSRTAVEVCQTALQVCGIHGYKNDTPFSVGRFLRDALSAPLMISNDRILGSTATMLLVSRLETNFAG